MKSIHTSNSTPKYQSGKWSWDRKKDGLKFNQHFDLEDSNERFMEINGYTFLRNINQEEEYIFRQLFVRPENTYDSDTVVINDVRDVVLFLMPKEFLSLKFLSFMHKPAVHRLLHALIIYFEYYLRLVEFILIRRDELSVNMAQIQSEQTNEMKRVFSIYLSHYRMLVARNYSIIIMGEGDMKDFYHTKPVVNISSKIKDRYFHEHFLAVATQIIWISMHRRAYYLIEMEMNRLFRSEHFLMNRREYLKLSPSERSLLYGRNNKMVNYRYQCSPMIQELRNVAEEDMPILWIGERKYRGNDSRIAEIELEYIVPGPQLRMIDVTHGILGHPKNLYDTILNLDWPSVRFANFSLEHDPYYLIRQPYLCIPHIDEMKMRRMSESYDHFFRMFRIYEPCSRAILVKWTHRDLLIHQYIAGGLRNDFISKSEKALADEKKGPVEDIVLKYYEVISRLRQKVDLKTSDATLTNSRQAALRRLKKEGDEYFFK